MKKSANMQSISAKPMANQKQLMMQKKCFVYPVDEIPMEKLLFDHEKIVKDFITRIKNAKN